MIREHPSIPTATYRLQFNHDFTFRQARELVPYLYRLGVSHVYSSPYFQARAESTHGYDIVDHSTLNAAIGSREDYDGFVEALHAHGMGQILDFVPNHMGIGEALNEWWMDVLENGPSSRYAAYFDIDFDPLKEELENKVLLPILGDQYGRVLEAGEFRIEFVDGAFFLHYYDHTLPLNPRSYLHILSPALEKLSGHSDEFFYLELQSVMTALEHLPVRTSLEPLLVEERAREKEIVKLRLDRLCAGHPEVLDAIRRSITELAGQPGDRRSFDALDELIAAQAYRLAFWRVASEEINYRRFFDINDLAAIRVEMPEVFERAHALVFDLLKSNAISGLRIDHVDGLWDPAAYLQQLQQRYREMFLLSEDANGLFLLVEKILSGDEQLRADWPVHGTTGYDFTNQVIRLLVDPASQRSMTMTYHRFIGQPIRFSQLVYDKKKLTMELSLSSEVNVLAYSLDRLSEKNRWYRDFTLNALTRAVQEVIASFPVYRTYLVPGQPPTDEDRHVINTAVSAARRKNPGIERSIFDFLRDILLMRFPENIDDADREAHEQFVMKFQQCTGPIMAKGLEDTAFYIYNRLAALNEVGGEPMEFGATPEEFHEQCAQRLASHPHSMLTTSTHDTKRSEDVRARIAAISETPDVWRSRLTRWRASTKRFKREVDGEMAPDANEEYLLYQILLGTWQPGERTPEELKAYTQRIQDYMTKAIKEAKVNSSWIQPNEEWDAASRDFIAGLLDPRRSARFLREIEPVAAQVAEIGMINALSQTVLKFTVPGVPDLYQGLETWDDSLVDPDNRRPVDFAKLGKMLDTLDARSDPAELLANWQDGRIKLFVTQRLLQLRREKAPLFAEGSYVPLPLDGKFADNALAFRRELGETDIVVLVPRLSSQVGTPPIGEAWADTHLLWNIQGPRTYVDRFTGKNVSDGALRELLAAFPVAVLVAQ